MARKRREEMSSLIIAKVRGGEVVSGWKPTPVEQQLSVEALWQAVRKRAGWEPRMFELNNVLSPFIRNLTGTLTANVELGLFMIWQLENGDPQAAHRKWLEYLQWMACETGLISRIGRPAFDGSRTCNASA